MRHRHDLVPALPQRALHLVQSRPLPDRRSDLRGPHAVRAEAIGERVGKVARVQHQRLVAGIALRQVRRYHVPAQRARARDDERLRCWRRGLEEPPEKDQGLAEGSDEAGADVGLAVERS